MGSQTSTTQPAQIVALQPAIEPVRYLLESHICLIGRAEICQIIIPHKIISRIQAVIKRDKSGHYLLHDGHSANGTYVNGLRLRNAHPLADQDEIGLALATPLLRFEVAPRTTPNDEVEDVLK